MIRYSFIATWTMPFSITNIWFKLKTAIPIRSAPAITHRIDYPQEAFVERQTEATGDNAFAGFQTGFQRQFLSAEQAGIVCSGSDITVIDIDVVRGKVAAEIMVYSDINVVLCLETILSATDTP